MSISEFSEVYLQDTFVFAWHASSDEVVFHVLAHLSQGHPLATLPSKGDWACYRPGLIVFQSVTSVVGLQPQSSVISTQDADGSLDYGTIDSLSVGPNGEFQICGEFGDVTIHAESLRLLLAPAA
ncbi:MAG: hypothetical protein OEL49_01500 [Azospira sp.]|nr:hypothetical protein [Azospira sp.]